MKMLNKIWKTMFPHLSPKEAHYEMSKEPECEEE